LAVNQTTSRLPGEPSPVTASPSVGYSSAGIVPYLPNFANGTDFDARQNASTLAVPSNAPALTVPASGDNKISPYAEAIQNPPDPENLNLDPKASAAWLGVLGFVKDSVTKVFNFASDIIKNIIPAGGHLVNQAGTSKKNNDLLTHAALGGAGLLALTSATNFINAFKTLFKWQTSEVPGVVDFINGLAKLGFAGLFASKAMAAEPIKKDEIVYGGAGLVLFKFIEDGMRGVGPFASIPGVKEIVLFVRDGLKALGGSGGAAANKVAGAEA
jgi:hypothetical protein